jgi:hypothetical protein
MEGYLNINDRAKIEAKILRGITPVVFSREFSCVTFSLVWETKNDLFWPCLHCVRRLGPILHILASNFRLELAFQFHLVQW